MVVLKQSGWKLESDCFLAKLVYSGKWLYLVKVVVFGLERFYSGKNNCIRAKVVVIGQRGCIRANLVVFVQSGCIPAKAVVFVQKWLYLCKSGCIRVKVIVFGKSSCVPAKEVVLGQK